MDPSLEVFMSTEWMSALAVKAKVAGLLGAALTAGALGGTFALTHVAPVAHQTVQSTAATSSDPETTDASDPETADAQDPETTDSPDPEATEASDPKSGQAQGGSSDCPADVKNHGEYVSSVARSAAHGKGAGHGAAVSAAAKSDCGKKPKDAAGSDGSGDPESGDAGAGHSKSGGNGGHAASHAPAAASHAPAAAAHGKGHGKH